jgi:protein gp37
VTAIEWTDATWNPTTGCDRVSPGCANCYALTLAARLKAMGQPRYQRDGDPRTSGPGFGLTLHEDKIDQPLRWRKPRMVFVNSMSDLFHEEVPEEFLRQVWDVMVEAKQHTFQVLTKRPENAARFLAGYWHGGDTSVFVSPNRPARNVWLGTSIENARYTYRADILRETPAAVRFISAEPLLGSLFPRGTSECPRCEGQRFDVGSCGLCENRGWLDAQGESKRMPLRLDGIDWLIAGGESGRGARPMDPVWVQELRDACLVCGTAFFFKQWGGRTPKSGGKILDGREWCEYPQVAA